MNNFLIYIEGALASPFLFQVKAGNNARYGRFAEVDVMSSELKKIVKDKEPDSMDVIEVRAGSMVRR